MSTGTAPRDQRGGERERSPFTTGLIFDEWVRGGGHVTARVGGFMGDQHRLVIDTISGLDSGRRCYRLVGGVLVERTVGEVLPAVRKNLEGVPCVALIVLLLLLLLLLLLQHHADLSLARAGTIAPVHTQIEQVVKTLNETLEQKDKALNDFKVQHKIRIMGEDADEAPAAQPVPSNSGVLV